MEREHRKEMIDNRMVKEDHQEGIGRVLQRKGDLKKGQGGKMHCHTSSESNFKRSGESLTPRRG